MSKSLDNFVGVSEGSEETRAKIRSFITDPRKIRKGDPGRPEICPIFALHRQFSSDILEWTEANCRSGELGCVQCKTNLADRVLEYYRPFRERRAELESKPEIVHEVLSAGRTKVRPVVEETMRSVRDAMRLG
jgi:tryptophanyl-tRNA synthetase